ncbi:MAG: hypothetical protein BACA_02052 [Bacteroides fragilis]
MMNILLFLGEIFLAFLFAISNIIFIFAGVKT